MEIRNKKYRIKNKEMELIYVRNPRPLEPFEPIEPIEPIETFEPFTPSPQTSSILNSHNDVYSFW